MAKDDNKPVTIKVLRDEVIKILGDFFETVISPYLEEHVEKRFDKIEKHLTEIDEHLDEHDRRFDKLDARLDRHGKMLDEHEEKIIQLQAASL